MTDNFVPSNQYLISLKLDKSGNFGEDTRYGVCRWIKIDGNGRTTAPLACA